MRRAYFVGRRIIDSDILQVSLKALQDGISFALRRTAVRVAGEKRVDAKGEVVDFVNPRIFRKIKSYISYKFYLRHGTGGIRCRDINTRRVKKKKSTYSE